MISKEDLVAGLKRAGSMSAYAKSSGVHRETLKSRFLEFGIDPTKVLESRRGRSAGVYLKGWSGTRIYLAQPRPEMILIEDVAHGLSNICRFGGHTDPFFSVAQHSTNVALRVLEKTGSALQALVGLLHDGHEAYIGDVPTPLKGLIGPKHKALATKLDRAIAASAGIAGSAWDDAMQGPVAEADRYFLQVEALTFEVDGYQLAGPVKVPVPRDWVDDDFEVEEATPIVALRPEEAREQFLGLYRQLRRILEAGQAPFVA